MLFYKPKTDFQFSEECCKGLGTLCQGTDSGHDGRVSEERYRQSSCRKRLLTSDEVPEEYRDWYICSGYRQPGLSVSQCILSVFQWHNETLNFWTHWFTLLFYIWFFCSQEFDLVFDPRCWPLLSFAIGACAFPLFSCVAHTFGCMTIPIRHICFFCDYAGISIYSIGSSVAFHSYSISRDLQGSLPERLFIPLNVVMAVGSCVVCCMSRDKKWVSVRCVMCTLAFAVPYLFCASLLGHRLVTSDYSPSLWFHYWQFFWSFMFAFAKSAKIPEKLMPESFDIIGHSHQWFHIFVFIGTYHQISAVILDLQEMKAAQVLPQYSFFSTVGMVLLVIVLDTLVVAYFSYQVLSKSQVKRD